MTSKPTTVLDANAVARAVKRIAHEIDEHNRGSEGLVLIGIVRRGVNLAERLAAALKAGLKKSGQACRRGRAPGELPGNDRSPECR